MNFIWLGFRVHMCHTFWMYYVHTWLPYPFLEPQQTTYRSNIIGMPLATNQKVGVGPRLTWIEYFVEASNIFIPGRHCPTCDDVGIM